MSCVTLFCHLQGGNLFLLSYDFIILSSNLLCLSLTLLFYCSLTIPGLYPSPFLNNSQDTISLPFKECWFLSASGLHFHMIWSELLLIPIEHVLLLSEH